MRDHLRSQTREQIDAVFPVQTPRLIGALFEAVARRCPDMDDPLSQFEECCWLPVVEMQAIVTAHRLLEAA